MLSEVVGILVEVPFVREDEPRKVGRPVGTFAAWTEFNHPNVY
jgi:hypothetical protein